MICNEKSDAIICEGCGRVMKTGYDVGGSCRFYAIISYDDCYDCFSFKNGLPYADTPQGLIQSAIESIDKYGVVKSLERARTSTVSAPSFAVSFDDITGTVEWSEI